MGLVQAFINQIGREAARDVYRSGGKKLREVVNSRNDTFTNPGILTEIENFELNETETTSIRQLSNLIEKSENTEVNNFEWEEIFIELDNKIGFCKEELDKQYFTKLNELDKKNELNFLKKKAEHISFVKDLITQVKKEAYPNKPVFVIAVLCSLLGLGPLYFRESTAKIVLYLLTTALAIILVYFAYGHFMYPEQFIKHSKMEHDQSLKAAKSLGVALGILGGIFYLLILFSSLKQIRLKRNENQSKSEHLLLLEEYINEYQ